MGLAISSGALGAGTTVIHAGKGILSGVMVISDNTNPATITVYDNATTGSGTVLAKCTATTTTGANSIAFVTPVRADNGLTVVVTGTGAPTGLIYYGS
jgi:hypothetical protein